MPSGVVTGAFGRHQHDPDGALFFKLLVGLQETGKMQQFIINDTIPGMNEIIAANRARTRTNIPLGALQKRNWTEGIRLCVLSQGLRSIQHYPVHLIFEWICSSRRRDPDNIVAARKFILDGLVRAKVLAGDGWQYIRSWFDQWRCEPHNPRIIVSLYEADEIEGELHHALYNQTW